MKAYLITYSFYYDNQLQQSTCRTQLKESPIEEEYSGADFDSLWGFLSEWRMMTPFVSYESKKGKRFIQHYGWLIKKITQKNCKPWKLVITSEETTISMRELMNYDTELVIKYFKERGMTACPILK